MDHIKDGYYAGDLPAVGPHLNYEAPHDQDPLPGDQPTAVLTEQTPAQYHL